MSRWARSRDANEGDIIKALKAAGCSVQATYGTVGEPDLIVGYLGKDHLMEVKNPSASRPTSKANAKRAIGLEAVSKGGEFEGMHPSLSWQQASWHRDWKGSAPLVVEYAHEALAHIGAPLHFCTCADCVADAALPGGSK